MKFEDPRCLIPGQITSYLDLARSPLPVDPSVLQQSGGELKRFPADFVVIEPRPAYPGMADLDSADYMRQRYLSVAPESDMPGLRSDVDLKVNLGGRNLPAVAMTVVKTGESTWRMVDMLAQHLSRSLGRHIPHHSVFTSGLKDRTAVTAQTVVVLGVTMEEMKRIDWSRFQPGRRGFFVKDVRPTDRLLGQGDHLANGFIIKVRVPGKTAAELDAYMYPRAQMLQQNGFWIPNAFHRQRLGPTQNNQLWGRTLLTGQFEAPAGINPFISNTEAMLFQLLFESSYREGDEARKLRYELSGKWQYNFGEMEWMLRQQYRRFNLTLEYEVARRLADDRFGGCADAVLYDLRDRLSIAVGAWQAYYWNWELAAGIRSGYLKPGNHTSIPLPMLSEDAKRYYGRSETGKRCMRDLAITERLANRAESYLARFIDEYWSRNAPSRDDRPDETGLSLQLVRALFGRAVTVAGQDRPENKELSAALVKHMFLVPRDRKTGQLKTSAPRRKAFVRVSDFDFHCDDEVVTLEFALRSGSYATMLVGVLFDTADPEEEFESNSSDDAA